MLGRPIRSVGIGLEGGETFGDTGVWAPVVRVGGVDGRGRLIVGRLTVGCAGPFAGSRWERGTWIRGGLQLSGPWTEEVVGWALQLGPILETKAGNNSVQIELNCLFASIHETAAGWCCIQQSKILNLMIKKKKESGCPVVCNHQRAYWFQNSE
uniref:Uncharacterized protein n=1 Tax=Oryza sativa subsp. japonica TaxID=39947 RepID=Q651D2_ORYSJ|nr:hypothetical protein [Oryza sativa Japonica Group]